MSESISLPPKRMSKGAAFGWLGAIGMLLVVVLSLPVLLFREQIALYATIWRQGPGSYPVVPLVPFPGPPTAVDLETFELDGLKFALPVDSVDFMTIGEELEGRLTIRLRNGLLVAIDRPVKPIPLNGEVDSRVDVYVASPNDFSWGASSEETRRLARSLALKKSHIFIDSATGVARTQRPQWEGYALRCPDIDVMNWLSADKAATGLVWIHRPSGIDANADELADVVFGSFEVTGPLRGTFDADASELVERYPAPPKAEEPEPRVAY